MARQFRWLERRLVTAEVTGSNPVRRLQKALAATLLTYNVCKMVMSDKTDPYECLVETLMSDRYDVVEAALR